MLDMCVLIHVCALVHMCVHLCMNAYLCVFVYMYCIYSLSKVKTHQKSLRLPNKKLSAHKTHKKTPLESLIRESKTLTKH